MKIKKTIISVIAAISLSTSAFCAEIGGIFKNESTLSVNKFDFSKYNFTQANGIYLWLTSPIANTGWDFSSEALYKIKFYAPLNKFVNILDVDLFKFSNQIEVKNGKFDFSIGRFFFADNTASIFAQVCDGAYVQYSLPSVSFGFYGGYTGLLNSLNVTMLSKDAYAVASGDSNQNVYSLAYRYVPILFSVQFPSLWGNQSLGVQGSAFIDLGSEEYNRFYLNLLAKGPVKGSIYYEASTTFGIPNFDFANALSNYTNLKMSYYIKENMAVYADVVYASGNNGFLHTFRGFTSKTAYYSYPQPELSGVIIPGAKFSMTGSYVSLETAAKLVFGVPDSQISFNGVEADGTFYFNVASDLQVSLDIKVYADIATKGENSNYQAGVNLVFAF